MGYILLYYYNKYIFVVFCYVSKKKDERNTYKCTRSVPLLKKKND